MVQNLEFSVHRRWLPYCSAFGDIGIDHEGSDLTELEVAEFFLELYDSTSHRRLASIVYFSLLTLAPCGRTRALARRTPWSRHCILDTQSWAYRLYIHRGIWPRRWPHQSQLHDHTL